MPDCLTTAQRVQVGRCGRRGRTFSSLQASRLLKHRSGSRGSTQVNAHGDSERHRPGAGGHLSEQHLDSVVSLP